MGLEQVDICVHGTNMSCPSKFIFSNAKNLRTFHVCKYTNCLKSMYFSLQVKPPHGIKHPAVAHPLELSPAVSHPLKLFPAVAHPMELFPAAAHPLELFPAAAHLLELFLAVSHPLEVFPAVAYPLELFPAVAHPMELKTLLWPIPWNYFLLRPIP
jgi:hypothetical protein